MDLFYTPHILETLTLNEEESQHCVKVLRHTTGDIIEIMDGCGTLHSARITSPHPRHTEVEILETMPNYNSHPYHLTMAVAPTKNIDRYEWFVEKAVEIGVDRIVPLLCRFSERKVVKRDRLEKIVVAAAKQSRKAKLPTVEELTPADEFIKSFSGKLFIAHCHEGEKSHLMKVVDGTEIAVMIGPEGDFSDEEVALALAHNAQPVSLGESRLRTETAAVVATTIVSLK